jgi:DNA-binding response OmpR family regulator
MTEHDRTVLVEMMMGARSWLERPHDVHDLRAELRLVIRRCQDLLQVVDLSDETRS